MKTLLIVTFLFLAQSLSSSELAWVDEQVNAIKPPRTGIKSSTIARLQDPFIFLKKKTSKKSKTKSKTKSRRRLSNKILTSNTKLSANYLKRTLTLDAVINHSALISGKWYKINDKINGYTLIKVNITSVVFANNNKKFILSTNSRNTNLKFKN